MLDQILRSLTRTEGVAILTLVLALILATACTPAEAPTATDVATAAIVLTDDALAVAIAVQPDGFDRQPWEDRVAIVEAAADAVGKSAQLCPYVKPLQAVASDILCARCSLAVSALKEALKCP
jgi:hypothetical protein